MTHLTSTNGLPVAAITIGHSRIKQYDRGENDSSVKAVHYMSPESKFEIELNNPDSNQMLVHISVNGISLHEQGILVDPYRRVYVDRYLNEDKAFVFKTLTMTDAAKEAMGSLLKQSGTIKVSFHRAVIVPRTLPCPDPDDIKIVKQDWYTLAKRSGASYCSDERGSNLRSASLSVSSRGVGGSLGTGGTMSFMNISAPSTNLGDFEPTLDIPQIDAVSKSVMVNAKVENTSRVGIVGEGGRTGQRVVETYTNNTFDATPCMVYEFKLLEKSEAIISAHAIRNYCRCGTKFGRGDKHCRNCGQPYYSASSGAHFCTKCGHPVDTSEQVFCGNCGARIGA